MPAQEWYPSPGHIVHTHVQYSDSEGAKSRFPVVVSTDRFNQQYPEVIVAFTTRSKNIKHPRGYDVEISHMDPQFKHTGLTQSTTVRCGRLWTVDKRKIYDVIGAVPDNLMNDIQRLVRKCFKDQT
jgi:mRNA-degrading endonuclease toxin of MazEF toxin-antitoxin module